MSDIYNAKEFAEKIYKLIEGAKGLDKYIDAMDLEVSGDGTKAGFVTSHYHDQKTGPHCHDIKPLGIVTYEIAITARYHRVEGDDE